MKAFVFLLFTLVLCGTVFAQENLPVIASLDFELNGVSESEAVIILDFITADLAESGKYRIIDRSQRENIMSEIALSMSGCTDLSCQLEIGKMLSADQLLVGSIGHVGDRNIINLKIRD